MVNRLNLSQLSDFDLWARTGRHRTQQGLGPIEVKFNPWHDLRTGEFTFRNAGRFFGLGSSPAQPTAPAKPRGFGGGGATGSWPKPQAKSRSQPHPQAQRRSAPPPAADTQRMQPSAPIILSSTPGASSSPPKISEVTKNGYRFQIDASARTRDIAGELHTAEIPVRSRTTQSKAGGADRQHQDDGGHYIAPRFNGPKDAFNHFAQDRRVNRGRYRALEDLWANALKEGKHVTVHIVPHYSGASSRPDRLTVFYAINGKMTEEVIPNPKSEKNHD